MKATKISPPPVPQPPVIINIKMDEREATLLMCCIGGMSATNFKTMVDKAAGIRRDGDIPSPDVGECGAFTRDLFKELSNISRYYY